MQGYLSSPVSSFSHFVLQIAWNITEKLHVSIRQAILSPNHSFCLLLHISFFPLLGGAFLLSRSDLCSGFHASDPRMALSLCSGISIFSSLEALLWHTEAAVRILTALADDRFGSQ